MWVSTWRARFSCRKTPDIPNYYREEGELVVPSYGYFIRGAQTTFSGVERLVLDIKTTKLKKKNK